ncbi:MAG: hypothetical protein ACRD42_00970 [Nitrososphaeraceae archaeon]
MRILLTAVIFVIAVVVSAASGSTFTIGTTQTGDAQPKSLLTDKYIYRILADTKTGTTTLADAEVLQEMQQAADETGEEFILLEHTAAGHEYKITLYSYDIKGQINPNTSLPDELEPIADFPNRGSLQETNSVMTAISDWVSSNQGDEIGAITAEICNDGIDNDGDGKIDSYYYRSGDVFISADEDCMVAPTEESSDQSEDEEDKTIEEEEEDSRGSDDDSGSSSRGNNDDSIIEPGKRGEEDKTDKITTKETEPAS